VRPGDVGGLDPHPLRHRREEGRGRVKTGDAGGAVVTAPDVDVGPDHVTGVIEADPLPHLRPDLRARHHLLHHRRRPLQDPLQRPDRGQEITKMAESDGRLAEGKNGRYPVEGMTNQRPPPPLVPLPEALIMKPMELLLQRLK